MIIIAELDKVANQHEVFNSSFLRIARKIFPEQHIRFYAERRHLKVIMAKAAISDASGAEVPVFAVGETSILNKTIRDFAALCSILRKKTKHDRLIITCIYPPALFLYNFFFFFSKRKDVLVIMHGELEFLNNSRTSGQKKLGSLLKLAMRLSLTGFNQMRYIVLGQPAKRMLMDVFHAPESKFLAIDHPLELEEGVVDYTPQPRTGPRLNLGFIGILTLQKRGEFLFSLAELLKEEVQNEEIQFRLIGRLHPGAQPFANNLVQYDAGDQLIARERFITEISGISYALFFYDDAGYGLRASGSFFDAITYLKPVIVIRNTYFSDFFQRFGNIGYMVDNLEEMKALLQKINEAFPEAEYREQVANIAIAKSQLGIDVIADQLQKQL